MLGVLCVADGSCASGCFADEGVEAGRGQLTCDGVDVLFLYLCAASNLAEYFLGGFGREVFAQAFCVEESCFDGADGA